MLLRSRHRLGRSLTVWTLVTGLAVGCWAGVGAGVTSLVSQTVWSGTFEDLLVAIASAALVASACWLWVVTTLTIADLVRGGESCRTDGWTRRLVLTACGVAVLASVSSPALAGSGTNDHGLAGLQLPDRATAGAVAHPSPARDVVAASAPAPARESHAPITVRVGDSLWSIARADLGPQATSGEIDERWRALYAANRSEIGEDPDLITPGQQLRQQRATAPDPDIDR